MENLGCVSTQELSRLPSWVPAPLLVGVELDPGPKRGEKLDVKRRWNIINLAEETKGQKPNYTKIARKVGCYYNSVKNLQKKYEDTGTVEDRPRKGRKRIFSAREAKTFVKKAKKGQSTLELARRSTKRASSRTIKRALRDSGMRYMRLKKHEKLTVAHKQRRVEYSKEMKGYDWDRVLFSDEKTFYLGASPEYAWQDPHDRPEAPKLINPPKLNVWAAVGTYMKTRLYYFSTNMNSSLYVKVLKTCLKEENLTFSDACPSKLRQSWVYLQDNARYHKTDESMDAVQDLVGNRWIEHPARSPDLNPMEDIWSYLDRKVKEVRPRTITSLKRVLTKSWVSLPWNYIAQSTKSMGRRLRTCIKHEGERLNY